MVQMLRDPKYSDPHYNGKTQTRVYLIQTKKKKSKPKKMNVTNGMVEEMGK
jgi:hypothetical protein